MIAMPLETAMSHRALHRLYSGQNFGKQLVHI